MAYDGITIELPGGLAGMVNHENRQLSNAAELFTANGVQYEDYHTRREGGAAVYASGGLPLDTFASYLGNLTKDDGSGNQRYFDTPNQGVDGVLLSYDGTSMAYVKTLGSNTDAQNTVTSIVLTITVPAGGVPIGNTVIVSSAASDDFPTTTTVTDTRGNTWNTDFNDATSAHQVSRSSITTALLAGDSITVTYTGLVSNPVDTSVVAVADEFSGVDNSAPVQTVQLNATTSNIWQDTLPTALGSSEDLVYASLVANMDGADPGPADPAVSMEHKRGFVPGTEDQNAEAASSTDVYVASAYRIGFDAGGMVAGVVVPTPDIRELTGSVSVTTASSTVTGSGTSFLSEINPNDIIIVDGQERLVTAVAGDTSLTVDRDFSRSATNVTGTARLQNRIMTAWSGGAVYVDDPATTTTGDLDGTTVVPSSTIESLTEGTLTGHFVVAGREAAAEPHKVFYFNGVDPVHYTRFNAGAAPNGLAVKLTNPPLDWSVFPDASQQPIGGVIHRSALGAFGNWNDPHRIYFSDVDDHADFTGGTSHSIRVRSDVGRRLVSAISFNGILFLLKNPVGIFWLDDSPLSTANWTLNTKSEVVGCIPSPYGALPLDDDIIFMAPNGAFHLMSAVDTLGGVRTSDITYNLGLSKWMRDNVNLGRLDIVQSVWHQRKKTALFAVPSTGSNERDLLLKWDFGGVGRGLPVRFSYSERDVHDALFMGEGFGGNEIREPLSGDDTTLYRLDQDDRNKNGAGYTTDYKTPDFDFGWVDPSFRYRRKVFDFLELVMEPTASGTITVDIFVDGTQRGSSVTFDATKRRDRKRIHVGDGHTFAIQVQNSAVDEDFKILSHLVSFRPGNEDKSR